MSLRQALIVELELDGGEIAEHKVDIDGRDIRAWEADTGLSALREPTTVVQMTWLAWHAMARTKQWSNGWEAYDAACVSVADAPGDEAGGGGAARPTRRARTGGS